jgi:hypothetical protein
VMNRERRRDNTLPTASDPPSISGKSSRAVRLTSVRVPDAPFDSGRRESLPREETKWT